METSVFNCVHVLQRMIEDSECVNDLSSQVFIIQMTHEEWFNHEGVRLGIDVCSSDLVQEGRLGPGKCKGVMSV